MEILAMPLLNAVKTAVTLAIDTITLFESIFKISCKKLTLYPPAIHTIDNNNMNTVFNTDAPQNTTCMSSLLSQSMPSNVIAIQKI